MDASLQVLYQDNDIIAVHKPAGIKVHRDGYDNPRTQALLQMVRVQTGRWLYPVHRLDRPASGVLLFAFSRDMARVLSDMFKRQAVEKYYLAVVRGYVDPAGEIDHPLTRNAYVPKQGQIPKPAFTVYRRLAVAELPIGIGPHPTCRYALVAVEPHTGRMHQIRRHFHHISHPLIGDTVYGDGRHNRLFRDLFGCHRLLLAAIQVRFLHPRTGESLCVQALPEKSFADILHQMGWQDRMSACLSQCTAKSTHFQSPSADPQRSSTVFK